MVRTPNLDALAAEGVRFARHYSQAAPCAPGRAALYTGTYPMNNRVVANGTPLDERFDNIARAAQRAGYRPALWGYSDQGYDPRRLVDPADPRWRRWEGVLPGFDLQLDLDERLGPWLGWLRELGYGDAHGVTSGTQSPDRALDTEDRRPVEHSLSAFTVDCVLQWLAQRDPRDAWFAHVSLLRPHPPYRAAGEYARRYDPADVPAALAPPPVSDPLLDILSTHPLVATPPVGPMRAQYYGMISEVDHHLGRLFDALRETGAWEHTVVVVTSDHGDQLGDQGLVGKVGYFESSFHIPAIVRDPRRTASAGQVVDDFTEAVDVMPTVCELIGINVPAQCDGYSLVPYLDGGQPPEVRDAAYYEFDWRDQFLLLGLAPDGVADRSMERQHVTVRRSAAHAYVQFGDGTWRCFDLAADPAWSRDVSDPAAVLPQVQAMLVWRATHTDRTLSGMLITPLGPIGRRPPGVDVRPWRPSSSR